MILYRLSITVLMAVCICMVIGCASVVQPGGGEKDTRSPKLLYVTPKNGSLNANPKRIEFVFDEIIMQQDLSNQILITPVIDVPYRTTVIKNKLRLDFETPFAPNTTITINLRDGVTDITEKTPASNAETVFSTGNSLDSLQISGEVYDCLNNKPLAEISVALYPLTDTLNNRKQRPKYLTKTNKEGKYILRNLAEGTYKAYAFEDKDKNGKYKDRTERLGFIDTTINLPNDVPINFNISYNDGTRPRQLSNKTKGNNAIVYYDKGLKSAKVIKTNQRVYLRLDNTELHLLNLDSNQKDTLTLLLSVEDSLLNIRKDTVKLAWNSQKDTAYNKRKFYEASPAKGSSIGEGETVNLTFADSVTNTADFVLLYIADTSKKTIPYNAYAWSDDKLKLKITIPKTPLKLKNTFYLPNNSIKLVSNLKFKGDTISYTYPQEDDFGIINVKVKKPPVNYFVELVDETLKRVAIQRNTPIFQFKNVKPGNYYLRLVYDINNDGMINASNDRIGRQPEKVKLRKDKILIKANFEIDEIEL